jgi:hypothetical protein
MSTIKQAAVTSVKVAGQFALRYILLAASGWLLSLVLCIALFPEWQTLFQSKQGMPAAAHTGWPGAVLTLFFLFISNPIGMFTAIAFPIGFPLVYHMAAMKGAAAHALNYVIRSNKSFLIEYPITKLKEYLQAKGMYDPAQLSLEQANNYVKKLSGMNRSSRICFRFIAGKLPMGEMIYETITSGEVSGRDVVNRYVDENFTQTKPTLYYIVLSVHILLFITIKIMY